MKNNELVLEVLKLTQEVLKRNDELVSINRALKGLPPDCDETNFSSVTKQSLEIIRNK